MNFADKRGRIIDVELGLQGVAQLAALAAAEARTPAPLGVTSGNEFSRKIDRNRSSRRQGHVALRLRGFRRWIELQFDVCFTGWCFRARITSVENRAPHAGHVNALA